MSTAPIDSFSDNLADAYLLVELAEALDNLRTRRARSELREKARVVIGANKRDLDQIDCIESDDFFVILKPGTEWRREDLQDRKPLLRQAVVAGAAAFEAFLGDAIISRVRQIMTKRADFPVRLANVGMTVGQWHQIEQFDRQWRKITDIVVGPHIQQQSSTAASQVGALLSLAGIDKGLRKIDSERKVPGGTTETQLTTICQRRNVIAHDADRKGRGRASIESAEVRDMLEHLESIAHAIDTLVTTTSVA